MKKLSHKSSKSKRLVKNGKKSKSALVNSSKFNKKKLEIKQTKEYILNPDAPLCRVCGRQATYNCQLCKSNTCFNCFDVSTNSCNCCKHELMMGI